MNKRLPIHLLLIVSAFSFLLSFILSLDPFSGLIDYQFQRRVEFILRAKLGMEPQVSPRLKILIYDDQAAAEYQTPRLSRADWVLLLKAVQARQPKIILIDKIFGYTRESSGEGADSSPELLTALGRPNVVLGAFSSAGSIPGRAKVFDAWQAQGDWREGRLPPTTLSFFGPNGSYLKVVKKVGLINAPVAGFLPVYISDSSGRTLPPLGFHGADDIKIDEKGVRLDGVPLPLVGGKILVNLFTVEGAKRSVYSLKTILAYARRGLELPLINTGDTVLILPEQLTGNAEHIDSYFGKLPAGLTNAAVLNSALTNTWISQLPHGWSLLILFSLLGSILAARLGPKTLAGLSAAVVLALAVSGLLLFIYHALVFSWVQTGLSYSVAAGAVFFIRSARREREALRVRSAIAGMIPKSKIEDVIAYQTKHPFKSGISEVTVMFIDIAGFSVAAAKMTTVDVFQELARMMGEITEAVQGAGGIVDKNLGDGMLCYFGYDFSKDGTSSNHAEDAVRAAVAIQRQVVARILEKEGDDAPVLPLRIGINTGQVFIGDLGGGGRIEFTIIGDAVNFAQRLEAASEDFLIMVGESSFSLLSQATLEELEPIKRLVKIKHHSNLFPAWEIDPYRGSLLDSGRAKSLYHTFAGKTERSERLYLEPETVKVSSRYANGYLTDVSARGIGVVLDTYLAKDVSLPVFISGKTDLLKWGLEELNLSPAICQVKWGRPLGGGWYEHGLVLQHLNEEQERRFTSVFNNVALPKAKA